LGVVVRFDGQLVRHKFPDQEANQTTGVTGERQASGLGADRLTVLLWVERMLVQMVDDC
jgi:hypothetical protein